MIQKTIAELNKIFKLLNKQFFEDKLVEPIILIQTKSKKHTLGTCSTNPIWEKKGNDKDKRYEITLSGKYLNRSIEEIVSTLFHECVHLYCSLNNIKDTSNSHVYHNKKFKEEAENRGLIIEKDKIIGWSLTKLAEPTIKLISNWKIDNTAFDYWRNSKELKVEKPKTTLNKYKCLQCETKITSAKTLNIICGDCNKKFELVEDK